VASLAASSVASLETEEQTSFDSSLSFLVAVVVEDIGIDACSLVVQEGNSAFAEDID
jgi:hypothetical protein